eukprot:COSAG02_NODE_808_length_16924_cov_117.299733_6_plen_56_part_00
MHSSFHDQLIIAHSTHRLQLYSVLYRYRTRLPPRGVRAARLRAVSKDYCGLRGVR